MLFVCLFFYVGSRLDSIFIHNILLIAFLNVLIMKNNYLNFNLLSVILLTGLSLTSLNAQEANTASGGNTSGDDGSISYSVGQLVYNTYSAEEGSIQQGVQQPYEISIILGIEEAESINLVCIAYPNPTTDLLWLKVDDTFIEDLSYHLFDLNGKSIENKNVNSKTTSISMSELMSGTYILRITSNSKEIKSFKIIKN